MVSFACFTQHLFGFVEKWLGKVIKDNLLVSQKLFFSGGAKKIDGSDHYD